MATGEFHPIEQTAPDDRMAARVLRVVEAILGIAAALVLAVLLLMVLVTVCLRYFFSAGFIGAEDLGIWLHVGLIALGAPLSLNSALAMRLDVFVKMLPENLQKVTRIGADVFTVLSALILSFGGSEIMTMLGGVSPTLGVPEWIRFGFLGAGGALILVMLLLQRIAEGKILPVVISLAVGVALYAGIPHVALDLDWPPSIFLGLIAAVGLVLAAPLPHAFLAAAYVVVAFGSSLPEPAIVSATVTGISKFLLLAIPFFLLAGGLLTASGVANQLVRFAAAMVGHRRAGLAQTTLLTSVLFSGASGSSVANAAFGASTFQPELVKHGYRPAQAAAIIASTSVLDNVIPPSIAFLILATATNLSVGSLLVGGFFAGGLMAICLAVAIHLTVREQVPLPRANARQRWQSAVQAIPAFGLGVIVVVGIRIGIVTTTEAAALAAFYTLLLGIGARLGIISLYAAFRQAAVEAAAIGLLIGTAGPFAFLLAVDDVSGLISHLTTVLGGSALAVILLSNVILLVVGLVLDIGAAILLFGPILLPAAVAAGIDPIQFGVIIVVNLMIHGLTPPLGMLIFVVSGVTRIPASELFRAVVPYLLALLVSLAILCAWAIIFS
ncbi:TRAP transporter large permease subunit [Rhizobium ruizarguesonis]|uniref:TRAP transporter large permease n=1 Tax=Rhizobium ruizarguesonis TaxID=2081791 RepID=UPI00102F49C2|nr:TRAP transporter large permease subunit [Rhizobium ruizarguesonis]QIJ40246.1 TRAP transporter large permease subunit [Rhizobium leguminosarum]NEH31721.1 TRAP transporter large permease subunit [Rhizobium ruizarguesonis]NEJ08822.1 TRAP transporter large permease subunit [Rhizobium ruizarguesonis]NEK11297.1 TRAP transporter large permease subunit [Rhizobium ruizarguesonis]TAU09783.1 TRAP transporter large permease subunit [Rhizobium ruizarguesonis]